MPESASFDDLVARLRARDGGAASEVFDRYARRLIGLARAHLGGRLRGKVEAEDVVQSALKSFFLRAGDGRLDLDSWGGLWAVLAVLTLRKCGRQLRFFRQERRDVGREVTARPAADESGSVWQPTGNEPGPGEAVELADLVEQTLRGLEGEDREAVVLRLQGHTVAEIAQRLGCSERRVYRLLELIKKRLARLYAEAGEGD